MQDPERYQRVERALAAVDAEIGAAEAQGLLCGMLSAPGNAGRAEWIAQVLADTKPRGDAAKECLTALAELFERTARQLDALEMDLELLLPADEAPLDARARALGKWCQGFLAGMGFGGLKQDTPLTGEVGEALRDLGAISQVELDAVEDEENESAYAELVEYVRVAVMLVRTTLRGQPPAAPSKSGKKLH